CPRSAPLRARGGGPRAPEPAGCWGRAGRRLEGRARRKSTGRGGAEMEVVETALVSSSEDKNTSNLLRTSQGVHKLGAGACFSDVVPPKASDDLVQGEAQHAALSRQELLDDCLHAKRNVVREVGHVRADEAEDWVSFR
ncbi:unnamed protein product, partial [Prorocentrum cordatum]